MSFVWAALPGLLSGAAIGMVYYTSQVVRRRWLLAQRRELALGQLTENLSLLLSAPDPPPFQAVMMAWEQGVVAVFDELHNQRLYDAKRNWPWHRVPDPGTPWPDFQPAPILPERQSADPGRES